MRTSNLNGTDIHPPSNKAPNINPLSCHARRLYEYRVENKLVIKRGAKRPRQSSSSEDEDPAPKAKPAITTTKKKAKALAAPLEEASPVVAPASPREAPQETPDDLPAETTDLATETPGDSTVEEDGEGVREAAAILTPLAVAAAKAPKAKVTMTSLAMKGKGLQMVPKKVPTPTFSGSHGGLFALLAPPPATRGRASTPASSSSSSSAPSLRI